MGILEFLLLCLHGGNVVILVWYGMYIREWSLDFTNVLLQVEKKKWKAKGIYFQC